MERIKQTQIIARSGDQAAFSQWDSMLKLGAVLHRLDSPLVAIHHQMHGADALGRQSKDQDALALGIHTSTEYFQLEGNKESPTAWFAVSDAMPFLTLSAMQPHTIGAMLGTKLPALAEAVSNISSEFRDERVNEVLRIIGGPAQIPTSVNEAYRQLTEGNWMGLVDDGKRSASNYTMSEIESAQKDLLLRYYRELLAVTPAENRRELRARFEKLVAGNGDIYPSLKGKTLPKAAEATFNILANQIHDETQISFERVGYGESTADFELPKAKNISGKEEQFLFLRWYLDPAHRDIYDVAHNESTDAVSNPIHSISRTKGETPFWVIIGGERQKLFLQDDSLRVGDHEVKLKTPIRDVQQLSDVLYKNFKAKNISVIPTAIGLMMQMRANGPVLLPEHGSSYTPQVDWILDRMITIGGEDQIRDLRPNPTVRVNPHGLSAIPDGVMINLPSHIREGFNVDAKGNISTTEFKAQLNSVLSHRRDLISRAEQAGSLLDKARILFSDSAAKSFIAEMISEVETSETKQAQIKAQRSTLMENVRGRLTNPALLKQIDAFILGKTADMPILGDRLADLQIQIEALRTKFTSGQKDKDAKDAVMDIIQQRINLDLGIFRQIGDFINGKTDVLPELGANLQDLQSQLVSFRDINLSLANTDDLKTLLTYLTALQFRQLEGGIEAIEYFDNRPSILTLYLLFGEDAVTQAIKNAEIYLELPGHKRLELESESIHDVEGNKLLLISDPNGLFTSDSAERFTMEQALRLQLIANGADSAIILTNSDSNQADVRMLVLEKDGSYSNFCGNASRLVAQLHPEIKVIETIQGNFVSITSKDGTKYVGLPVSEQMIDNSLKTNINSILGGTFNYKLYTAAGEPHLVIDFSRYNVADINTEQLRQIGLNLQQLFGNIGGVNVDFVFPDLAVMVFERGVDDFTGSCGTGASSIAAFLEADGDPELNFYNPNTGDVKKLNVLREAGDPKSYLQV